jgi:hypothetical protein
MYAYAWRVFAIFVCHVLVYAYVHVYAPVLRRNVYTIIYLWNCITCMLVHFVRVSLCLDTHFVCIRLKLHPLSALNQMEVSGQCWSVALLIPGFLLASTTVTVDTAIRTTTAHVLKTDLAVSISMCYYIVILWCMLLLICERNVISSCIYVFRTCKLDSHYEYPR